MKNDLHANGLFAGIPFSFDPILTH